MTFERFIIYPEAHSKLQASGLAERVLKESKTDHFFGTTHGFISESEMISTLRSDGYFKTIPKDLKQPYQEQMNAIYTDSSPHLWIVKKKSGEVKEKPQLRDQFQVLSGYSASAVLKPEEFWDFNKYGFSSMFELFGVLGAHIDNLAHGNLFREGGVWESEFDGSKFISEVTGSEHGDLRIYRTDVTPYETHDPFGNKVPYRPVLDPDRQMVIGYHSQEPDLLAALIKYAEQEKIPTNILTKDKYQLFLESFKGKRQFAGNFADFGYEGPSGVGRHFWTLDIPMPTWDGSEQRTAYGLGTAFRGSYGIFVGQDGGFTFVRDFKDSEEAKGKKVVALNLPSTELDQLVRAMFVQAEMGLGRTSMKQLIDVIDFKFSGAYEKMCAEMAEIDARRKKQ